ncbi:MAG: TonB family protein, partial [Acidobacteria bacterium]
IPVQFHPLIWYLVRKMRRQCELACDEIVTASLMSKRAYARRLLEVAAGSIKRETMRPQLAFGTDSLEERIRALLAPSKFVHSEKIQRLTMMLACSILLTAGVGTGLVFVRAQDQTPAGQVQARPSGDAPNNHIMSDEGFTPPKVLTQTIPSYTEEALSARVQGAVLLSCIIRRTGRATDFLVLRGLPYGLDEAAINEIRDNWRFGPATFNGHAVDFQTTIEVTFNLRDRDRVPLSEAEGLIVERVELVGLSEEQAKRARALIKVGEQAKFQKVAFESDVKTLKEKFGLTAGTVYKGGSGRVIVKYRFAAK